MPRPSLSDHCKMCFSFGFVFSFSFGFGVSNMHMKSHVSTKSAKYVYIKKKLRMKLPIVEKVPTPWESIFKLSLGSQRPYGTTNPKTVLKRMFFFLSLLEGVC